MILANYLMELPMNPLQQEQTKYNLAESASKEPFKYGVITT